jgi:acetylornithine/succinyldiaminopimelate/putrescine aminotransferase
MGLMCGVELAKPGACVVQACMQKGLLINCTHERVLRIMPALNVRTSQINAAIKILDAALSEVSL